MEYLLLSLVYLDHYHDLHGDAVSRVEDRRVHGFGATGQKPVGAERYGHQIRAAPFDVENVIDQ